MPKGDMPVLVGVGQITSHWEGKTAIEQAPNPKSLCLAAAQTALADAGVSADMIDTLAVVRTFEDSLPGGHHPHERLVRGRLDLGWRR